jgi:hypothetical protein
MRQLFICLPCVGHGILPGHAERCQEATNSLLQLNAGCILRLCFAERGSQTTLPKSLNSQCVCDVTTLTGCTVESCLRCSCAKQAETMNQSINCQQFISAVLINLSPRFGSLLVPMAK